MSNINGFFGNIQGPFDIINYSQQEIENNNQTYTLITILGEDLFIKANIQSDGSIDYISKMGLVYTGDLNLDVYKNNFPKVIISIKTTTNDVNTDTGFIEIHQQEFQIGKTKMLELENTSLTSIQIKIQIQYLKTDLMNLIQQNQNTLIDFINDKFKSLTKYIYFDYQYIKKININN